MVSVVKYFRRNQFQKKLFSRKYFSAFGSHKKITKSENATESGEHVGLDPAILARSGRISGGIRSDQAGFRPVSVHGRIPARFRRHSAQLPDVAGFRRPAVFRQPAVFRWSDSDADIILVT
jgi:hypothetical protein